MAWLSREVGTFRVKYPSRTASYDVKTKYFYKIGLISANQPSQELILKTVSIPSQYRHISTAGAQVRPLMDNEMGGIAHCTLPSGKITKAVAHKTVSEFWHVISGEGDIWRRQGNEELITHLEPGVTIDIPLGTEFQYRCTGNSNLVFVCVTMPPWPGPDEVTYPKASGWNPN